MARPTLYGASASPFVRKARIGLIEKGIDHAHEMVSPFGMPPELRAKTPLGKIPFYEEGDFCIADSSVILDYLEQTHPQPALYPDDPKQRARALFFEEYGDTKLAEGCGAVFFNRLVRPLFLKQECDEGAVKNALTELLPPLFDWLEEQVGDREHLVAGRFSIADIGIATHLRQLGIAGEGVDAGRWPKLAAYAERLFARPSFKGCIEEEDRMLEGLKH